ncbi:MAG: transposase [Candidatus Zixiibacteriota bacterium]
MLKAGFRGIVGCRRYRRTRNRNGERKGFYQRVLLTLHGWLEGIEVPRLRTGGWGRRCWRSIAASLRPWTG